MNEVLIVSRAVAFVFYPSLSSKNWNTSHCREWCAHSDGRDGSQEMQSNCACNS